MHHEPGAASPVAPLAAHRPFRRFLLADLQRRVLANYCTLCPINVYFSSLYMYESAIFIYSCALDGKFVAFGDLNGTCALWRPAFMLLPRSRAHSASQLAKIC